MFDFEVITHFPTANSKQLKQLEKDNVGQGNQPWTKYDSPFFDWEEGYTKPLQDIMPDEGIKDFLKNLSNKKNKRLDALEIGGTGKALLELKPFGVKKISAVTLNDFRSLGRKIKDFARHIKVIEGAIEEKDTLGKAAGPFDLIVSVARGGVVANKEMMNLDVIAEIYKLMSGDSLLMTQLPPKLIEELGSDWIEALSKTPGINVKYAQNVGMLHASFGRIDTRYLPAISIVKTSNAPANIDFIKNTQPNPQSRKSFISTSQNR